MTVCVFDFESSYMLADAPVMEGMVFCERVRKIRQFGIKGKIYTFATMGESTRANFLADLIREDAIKTFSIEERVERENIFKSVLGDSFAAVLCVVHDPDTLQTDVYEYYGTTLPVRVLPGPDNLAIIAQAGVKLALRSAMAAGASLTKAYQAVSKFDASLRMYGDEWYAERVYVKVRDRAYQEC